MPPHWDAAGSHWPSIKGRPVTLPRKVELKQISWNGNDLSSTIVCFCALFEYRCDWYMSEKVGVATVKYNEISATIHFKLPLVTLATELNLLINNVLASTARTQKMTAKGVNRTPNCHLSNYLSARVHRRCQSGLVVQMAWSASTEWGYLLVSWEYLAKH